MFGFLKKGLSKIKDGALFIGRRKETWIIASFVTPPVVRAAIPYIRIIEDDKLNGEQKLARALKALRKDPQFTNMKNSKLRWIVETALQSVEGELQMME